MCDRNETFLIFSFSQDESTYLLKDTISLTSMSKFVYDFYNRTYPRFLRANNISFKNTHSFNMSEFRKENKRTVQAKRKESLSSTQQVHQEGAASRKSQEDLNEHKVWNHQHHYVREINSRNFQQAVINVNKVSYIRYSLLNSIYYNTLI